MISARIRPFALHAIVAAATACLPHLAVGQVVEKIRVRPDTKVNRLLDGIDQAFAQSRYEEPWAAYLKQIADLGPEAVPDLIAELDSTESDIMLRNLGFILRAIGDKRAVPALIRAFPKTLRKPGSDLGLRASDRDLLAFLQQHDLNERDRDGMYGFGRPVREIGAALEKLTGVDQGEHEIFGVFLSGSSHQQALQRQLYHRCAERWAAWWEKNWKDHVTDEKYSRVNLPDDEPVVIQVIPTGPGMKIGGGSNGHILESDSDPNARREVFFDLDTGRALTLPKHLQSQSDDPNRLDKIQDWAAREGFDLMGTTYTPANTNQPCFVIRALGLTAWEIDQARWDTIGAEIKEDKPLQMGRPASGLLLHFDEQKNDYDPTAVAVFLFVTRESSYGILFVGVEVLDTNVQVGVPSRGNQTLNPVGFYKGRRFSLKMFEPLE